MKSHTLSLLLCVAVSAARAQEPSLSWSIPASGSRDVQGLLIQQTSGQRMRPLLPYIFFEEGSAKIPDRYLLFTDPAESAGFSEAALPDGTLDTYRSILNIIGARLRENPTLTLKVQGCNSRDSARGETMAVSERRAKAIVNYLTGIWRIDEAQVVALPPRNLPALPSNQRDPLGPPENQRAELLVDDPTGSGFPLLRPVAASNGPVVYEPAEIVFHMRNGLPNELVARRRIEIERNGRMWQTLTSVGVTDTLSPPYGWEGSSGELPTDAARYVARLVLTVADGTERRSAPLEIPVQLLPPAANRAGRVEEYALILFEFDSPKMGRFNEHLFSEYILPSVANGAEIAVHGHFDVERDPESRARRLARSRTTAVAERIKQGAKAPYGSLDTKEVEPPLYTNDLPEGRFYNRTVIVWITSPASRR